MSESGIPVLTAYLSPTASQALVWCGHCRSYHWHGPKSGHRADHCHVPGSPYDDRGYILEVVGPAPRSVLADARRRRPKGPAAAQTARGAS